MNFFKSLLTADGDISSKRFAGLSLIALFMTCTIVSMFRMGIDEGAISLVQTSLVGGAALLGVSIVTEAFGKKAKKDETE